jgi:hypothetical protein
MVGVDVLGEEMVGDIPKSKLNKEQDGNGTGGEIPWVLIKRKAKIVLKDDRKESSEEECRNCS